MSLPVRAIETRVQWASGLRLRAGTLRPLSPVSTEYVRPGFGRSRRGEEVIATMHFRNASVSDASKGSYFPGFLFFNNAIRVAASAAVLLALTPSCIWYPQTTLRVL